MMFQEHLKSCGYCQNIYRATSSVTTTRSYPNTNTNTNTNDQLKKAKLRELGKIVSGE
jgi:hypothetical protein